MLRKQITDCLRWIKHNENYGYWVMRAEVEENLDSMDVTHTALSLKALLNFIEQQGYTDIFISASSYRDYEDYDGYKIVLSTHRKQTDEEYFESLCEYIIPTEYQQNQYETYLKLKQIYEDKNNEIMQRL